MKYELNGNILHVRLLSSQRSPADIPPEEDQYDAIRSNLPIFDVNVINLSIHSTKNGDLHILQLIFSSLNSLMRTFNLCTML